MAPPPNYYEILGIDISATQDEVRQAYKSLVLKHHPDKTKDTASKIYEINEAFRVLNNPQEREQYDRQVHITNIFDFSFVYFIFSKLLEEIANAKSKLGNNAQKPADIVISLPVTLEDIHHHRVKKCVVQVLRNDQKQKQILYVSLANYEEKYVFKGLGDWNGVMKGDVVINLKIEQHTRFIVDSLISKYDLWMEKTITLYEYLYGVSFDVIGLDGSHIAVSVPFFDLSNMTQRIAGKGLCYYDIHGDADAEPETKHGDLYIFYKLDIKRPSQHVLDRQDVGEIFRTFF